LEKGNKKGEINASIRLTSHVKRFLKLAWLLNAKISIPQLL